jgi:hypothetical protein
LIDPLIFLQILHRFNLFFLLIWMDRLLDRV